MDGNNILMDSCKTFPQLFLEDCQRWGSKKVAMRRKKFGIWNDYTWKDSFEKVKYFCLGLIALGLNRTEKVCLLGDNEPELFWGMFGVQAAGGVVMGVFADAGASEVQFLVNNFDTKFILVSDQEQVDKMLSIREQTRSIEKVIWWDPKGMSGYKDSCLMSFDEIFELGKKYEGEHPGAFEHSIGLSKPEDCCQIFYTSGTTGEPKGVVHTYQTLTDVLRNTLIAMPMKENDDALSYLPPAWFAEFQLGSAAHLATGLILNFCEATETLMRDLREVSPVAILWGARQWENMASSVQTKLVNTGNMRRWLYNVLLPVRYEIGKCEYSHTRPNLFWRIADWIAKVVIFDQIRDTVGFTRNKFSVTAGSTLGVDTQRLLHAIGIKLRQLYGSSEAGTVFLHRTSDIRPDSVGSLVLGCELRIAESGEALVRGPSVFTEYYNNPQATNNVLREGWYHTGDALSIDSEDGHGYYLDRVSEMGDLSQGRRYAPQYIEAQLRFSPFIKDAMVLGGRERDYLSVLVNIDFDSVGRWAEQHRVIYTTYVDLSQRPEVADLIHRDISRVNKRLQSDIRIKKYVLMYKEFDADESELTRTRKLRRSFIEKRYSDLIGTIYSDNESILVQTSVTYRDGRTGSMKAQVKIWPVTD